MMRYDAETNEIGSVSLNDAEETEYRISCMICEHEHVSVESLFICIFKIGRLGESMTASYGILTHTIRLMSHATHTPNVRHDILINHWPFIFTQLEKCGKYNILFFGSSSGCTHAQTTTTTMMCSTAHIRSTTYVVRYADLYTWTALFFGWTTVTMTDRNHLNHRLLLSTLYTFFRRETTYVCRSCVCFFQFWFIRLWFLSCGNALGILEFYWIMASDFRIYIFVSVAPVLDGLISLPATHHPLQFRLRTPHTITNFQIYHYSLHSIVCLCESDCANLKLKF